MKADINYAIDIYANIDGAGKCISPYYILLMNNIYQMIVSDDAYINIDKNMIDIDNINKLYPSVNLCNVENHILNKKFVEYLFSLGVVASNNLRWYDIETIINTYSNGMIKNIINEHDINTNPIIMVTVLKIKITWLYKFNIESTTITNKFQSAISNPIYMMYQLGYHYYSENNNYQLLELLTDNSKYAMGFILPKKWKDESNIEYDTNGVPMITGSELNKMIQQLKYVLVDIYIPKFNASTRTDMSLVMSKINPGRDWYNFIHYASVDIDENGIRENIIKENTSDKKYYFHANHIFIYYMRNIITNTIIIYGDYQ